MISKLNMVVLAILVLNTSLLLSIVYLHVDDRDEPIVIGKLERVGVEAIDTVMKARIDTGAGVTSLNAQLVETIRSTTPDGHDKVKFQIKDDFGHAKILEKEVVEWQRIKNKGEDGYTERPVVRLDLCLGGREIHGRVNLVDRNEFKYQLLIGRNFLETGAFVVDVRSELTTHRSRCK